MECLLGRLGAQDMVTGVGGDAGDELADDRVVVDHEHAVSHGSLLSFEARFSGSVRQAGSRLSTQRELGVRTA
jgi:hypothetical protein